MDTILFGVYLKSVDTWDFFENADLAGPRPIASKSFNEPTLIHDSIAWKNLEELAE